MPDSNSIKDDLQQLFKNPAWRPLPRDEKKWALHQVRWRKTMTGIEAVLVVKQSQNSIYNDFGANKAALHNLADAEREGRAARGFVALVDRTWTVVAMARIKDVLARISDARPIPGQWGEYFWLNSSFESVAFNRI